VEGDRLVEQALSLGVVVAVSGEAGGLGQSSPRPGVVTSESSVIGHHEGIGGGAVAQQPGRLAVDEGPS